MRSIPLKYVFLYAFAVFSFFSCSEKTEQFESEPLSDYTPVLQPGKYITYRVDSLVFPNFGRSTEIHKYQQKHVIDALITDNLGRPSYRVFRFLSDSTGTQPWVSNGSYMITPLNDQVEVIEDNLRFVKLHLPINEGFTWPGNTFLPANAYFPLFGIFGNDDDMSIWEYYYDQFEPTTTIRNYTYSDVWTIEAADESFNLPIVDPSTYAARTRAMEKYSKGIGMVYREYELWEYQPNTGQPGGPYKTGFGVTMWMIDHN